VKPLSQNDRILAAPKQDRRKLPRDYARDVNGKVSKEEFQRWLPMIRCVECGTWVQAAAKHSIEDCALFKRIDRG